MVGILSKNRQYFEKAIVITVMQHLHHLDRVFERAPDLAGIATEDSSGISAITGTYVSLSRQGGSLKLLRPCGRVRAVLRVIRLLDIIPTF